MTAPTSLERDILRKFEDKLADVHFNNDKNREMLLIRFLRARNLNLSKAEDMLRKHLEWQKVNNIDSLLMWTPPLILTDNYQYDVAGFDKEGCPILIAPFGTWDVRKLCENGLKDAYVKYVDQLFLHVTHAMEESSKKKGYPITQFTCIMVPDGFQALRQMSSPQAVETVLETVRRFESNYPETLKCAFVVDAPKVFNLIFNVIKPLLNSATLGKVTIASHENEWKAALLNIANKDQLCVRLGGTRPSRVPILNTERGTFRAGQSEKQIDEDFYGALQVTVAAGQSFKLQQEIHYNDSLISWMFKTDNHDIGFSVMRDDVNEEIVAYSRVNSHVEPYRGTVRCIKGKYTLVFDNSFSRFRSKILRYKVSVQPQEVETEYETKSNGCCSPVSSCPSPSKVTSSGAASTGDGDPQTGKGDCSGNHEMESTSL